MLPQTSYFVEIYVTFAYASPNNEQVTESRLAFSVHKAIEDSLEDLDDSAELQISKYSIFFSK